MLHSDFSLYAAVCSTLVLYKIRAPSSTLLHHLTLTQHICDIIESRMMYGLRATYFMCQLNQVKPSLVEPKLR